MWLTGEARALWLARLVTRDRVLRNTRIFHRPCRCCWEDRGCFGGAEQGPAVELLFRTRTLLLRAVACDSTTRGFPCGDERLVPRHASSARQLDTRDFVRRRHRQRQASGPSLGLGIHQWESPLQPLPLEVPRLSNSSRRRGAGAGSHSASYPCCFESSPPLPEREPLGTRSLPAPF